MPRGKIIKRSLDEQISMLEEDIRAAQNKLNRLQTRLKELQLKKREEDMAELYTLIKESGLSLDEVRTTLAQAPKHTQAPVSENVSGEDSSSDTAGQNTYIA